MENTEENSKKNPGKIQKKSKSNSEKDMEIMGEK